MAPGAQHPFKVVFTRGGSVLSEWPVQSEAEGERQIIEALSGLADLARQEGEI